MRPPTGNRISQGSHGATKAIDYSDEPDVFVYAPEDLTFDSYQQRGSGELDAGNCLRGKGANGLHQFAHLEETYFKRGTVKKGERIAKMGHTGYTIPKGINGRHLHYWLKTPNGTYVYPPTRYKEPFGGKPTPPSPKMPAVDSDIRLIPVDTRTTFRAGTTTVAGQIHVKDNTYVYTIRGYDSKFPGRVLINSASAGGDGVALALYYVNGTIVPGWKKV